MVHSAVADAEPWPKWLCPSGELASQLRPLDDVPCFSEGAEAKQPEEETQKEPEEEIKEEEEKHTDDDDDDGEQSHKQTAVAAKLAQDEEEARAQAAVAAKRKQAATLEGCVHLGKVKQKRVDTSWWSKGVHQIVLWVGTAVRGKGASKGSGKGKGASKGSGKGKTKGQKW